ncbi:sulfatase-like hydrolase/transferase [Akkermansiaceae bacterium]|nr:sulfatase-like hydrolase/transferase [Akkermansiaceae bacterium]MDB4464892.1 sulfatase-like hydrolase/transferase [Akkermansiaceae bacterium]
MKHLLFLLCILATLTAADRPHIILVMADDQGYGDCGFTGHPYVKTPNLDAMSKNSVVFDRFYAGAPVCSPTRASVMTGRNPVRVNVPNHGHYLRPHETTIAEALKSSGYLTAHFGKWHIGSVQKESPTSPGGQGFDHWLSGLNFFDREPYLSLNGTFQQFKGQGTVISMDHALEHLKSHAPEHPTFTVIWFPSPHDPHRETSANPSLYQGKPHAPYYQEITLIDEQIGRLRTTLRDLKIADNTLLWYTSDNGGLVKEHSGGREKKGSVYEGGLRVPSLIEYPAKFKPTRITAPTSATDIYPTLLALTDTNVENQTPLDGINLLPFISGDKVKRAKSISFWHRFTGGQSTQSDRIIKKLMEAQQAKQANPFPDRLLKNVNDFPKYEDGSHQSGHAALLDWPFKIHGIYNKKKITWELYDLSKDPMETTPLNTQQPQRLAGMQKQLTTWQKSVLSSHAGNDYKKQ